MSKSATSPVSQYRKLDVQTSVATASSHHLITLLFEGARDRINQAQGCIKRGDYQAKSVAINSVVEILSGLQASLDHEQGGDIAANLDSLYDYMQRRLFRANCDNDVGALLEVADLVTTLRTAWVSMDLTENVSAG